MRRTASTTYRPGEVKLNGNDVADGVLGQRVVGEHGRDHLAERAGRVGVDVVLILLEADAKEGATGAGTRAVRVRAGVGDAARGGRVARERIREGIQSKLEDARGDGGLQVGGRCTAIPGRDDEKRGRREDDGDGEMVHGQTKGPGAGEKREALGLIKVVNLCAARRRKLRAARKWKCATGPPIAFGSNRYAVRVLFLVRFLCAGVPVREATAAWNKAKRARAVSRSFTRKEQKEEK